MKTKVVSYDQLADYLNNPQKYSICLNLSGKYLNMSHKQLMDKKLIEVQALIGQEQLFFELVN